MNIPERPCPRKDKATEWITFDNKYMRHDIGKAIDEA